MIPIGICTDFSNLPEAHALGYDFVEVYLSQLTALSDAYFDEFTAYCEGSGIHVRAVNDLLPEGLDIVGPNVRAPALHGYLTKAFGRCQRLNVRVATLDAARPRQVPGGVCGFWGACGAGISTGMYVSIITGSSPLAEQTWGLSNQMTSEALGEIAKTGGPRCCKRDSYTAIRAAVNFTKEHFGVEMEYAKPVCTHVSMKNQCIGARCPYRPGNH